MTADVERAAEMIAGSQAVVVISHERPDGDAVGSMLAMSLALQEVGKVATPVLEGGLPRKWLFLPGAGEIQPELPSGEHLIVSVDSADIRRFGGVELERVDLNIDHHPSNTQFGAVNLVDREAAATTEVLYRLFPQLNLPINLDIASNMLLGLITDTLGFRTSSVSPRALRVAAELMERGADMHSIYQKGLVRRSYEAVSYWSGGLTRLDRRDGMVWAALRLADREQANYPTSDDADLIDVLTTIEGPRVALMFVEQQDNVVKISWRALPGLNVSRLAANFGGGGHEAAAGASIEGALDEVMKQVLEATAAALEEGS